MLRKIVAGTVLLSAAPIAAAAIKDDSSKEPLKCRPSELPIYSEKSVKSPPTPSPESESIVRSSIEGGVKVVRECCCDCVNSIKKQKEPIDNFVQTGKAHSQFIFDYLNEPANGIHRTGAIAVGALSGYIIAIRRGFIRRLIYASAGGLGIASLCYPKEAEQYWQQALTESKTYATVFYNFAYGVKPGDEPKPLPNIIPDNLKEAYGSVTKYFSSAKK